MSDARRRRRVDLDLMVPVRLDWLLGTLCLVAASALELIPHTAPLRGLLVLATTFFYLRLLIHKRRAA